ncbi:Serine phosphatase RsbU, regulator of sigma subunit [Olavius algarvensis Delta 1 endosymbiont]|nr:Serine phosphatase RsbU, regulator of sigma subunit [Olavius algarvensis Delta 1 endosymbiont]
MAQKPSYEELQEKVASLQKEVKRHRKREDVYWRIQERLSQIIDSIPIPTFVLDNEHNVIHYNPAMENLTGIAHDEIIGTRDAWKAFYSAARPTMADLILDGAPEQEIARYYRGKYGKSTVKAGAYEAEDFFPDIGDGGRWLYFTAAPLLDSEGNVLGALETLQDTTERRRAVQESIKSERQFRTLLDFAPYSIVVFSLDGLVSYLNPAFTDTFGWTLAELRGQRVPYVPPELEAENREHLRKLMEEKIIRRYETRRLTKDGRSLDVVWRASVFADSSGEPAGVLVILRDITRVKRIARNNEAMQRISMALPEYPELLELLDFVCGVIKELMETEGGLVILLDEQRQELILRGAAYDDTATQQRAKETRFQVNELVAGKVIKSGEPIILNDISGDSEIHLERDRKLGYQTRNLLLVPLKSQERTIGTLCAVNKKKGGFDQADVDLLSMLAGTVALSIENARFAADIKKAYMEVSSLNRAKDKVINHLSHELKTPIAVLRTSLVTLEKRLQSLPEKSWQPTIDRARRNLDRLLEMQYQIYDIVQHKTYKTRTMLSHLLDQCSDELEALIAEQIGEGEIVKRIRKYIDDTYGDRELIAETIHLDDFVGRRLKYLKPAFAHREVKVLAKLSPAPPVQIPQEVLQKSFDGLLKNAVENTPDEGRIEIIVKKKGRGTRLEIRDFGVGLTPENQVRIFEGFFTTRETLDYSSKKPFDFNAGGKGADLLRMKIFAERYGFKIGLKSSRCPALSRDNAVCTGRISTCSSCQHGGGCHQSAATRLKLYFPPSASG